MSLRREHQDLGSNKDNIHIYLKTDKQREAVFNETTSSHERYIILMNDELHSENKELNIKLAEMTIERDEAIADTDRLETAKRYSNGLLKNLGELNKMYIAFNTIMQSNYTTMHGHFNSLYRFNTINQYLCLVAFLLQFATIYTISNSILAVLCGVLPVMYYGLYFTCFSSHKIHKICMLDYSNHLDVVKKSMADIEKITKSQDFLGDLIDNI